jgi:hypothetical protein
VRRRFFDRLLESAVESSFQAERHGSHQAWKQAVTSSDVRLQWDPDHHPSGAPLDRRAIQLGLRGAALAELGQREILEILDLSSLVAEQRSHVESRRLDLRETPLEWVYVPADEALRRRLLGL